jgi:hypothetical protein
VGRYNGEGPKEISALRRQYLVRSERTKTSESIRLEKRREWLRWYRRTAKGKEATRRSNEKYHKSEKGKAANARYAASAKGKAVRARYLASPKRKAVRDRYLASPKGKEAVRRSKEKYRKSKTGKAARARYLASPKGKAFKRAANQKHTESKRKDTMRRQYAKKVWKALADRYGMGTLDQIQREIQRRLTNPGPDRPGLQGELVRDEKRCRRAIDAIGAEYPEHIKPARQPTRFGVSRKRR